MRWLLLHAGLAAAVWAAGAEQLPWLHVRPVDLSAFPGSTRRHVLADDAGREVTLRGACVEAEVRNFATTNASQPKRRSINVSDYEGVCPDNYQSYQEPPICQVDAGKGRYNASSADLSHNDYAQVRALGFNVVRLCLSWSELEPQPGVYSTELLDRVEQLVDWAEEQGVYTVRGKSAGSAAPPTCAAAARLPHPRHRPPPPPPPTSPSTPPPCVRADP